MSDLDRLAAALQDADDERSADLDMVGYLDPDELDYLARVGELPDPVTDGIEGECV